MRQKDKLKRSNKKEEAENEGNQETKLRTNNTYHQTNIKKYKFDIKKTAQKDRNMNRERRNKQIEKHPLHGNKTKMNEKRHRN